MEKEEKEEKGSEDGLHLTDKTIQRISGPVSMYYLKPKTTKSFNGVRENLPLVLLWGDEHRDDQGMCADCTCMDSKGCCHRIYDREFLQDLDKLASHYPVDFYTETSSDMSHIVSMNHPKNVLFHYFLQKTTRDCHQKVDRSTPIYEMMCPTKNIRWHYSDPRFMEHTVERYAFAIPFLSMSKIIQARPFHRLFRTYQIIEKGREQDRIPPEEQKEIQHVIDDYREGVLLPTSPFIPSPNSNHYPLYQEGSAIFLTMARLALLDDLQPGPTLIEDLIRPYVTSMVTNDKSSVIYKQLKTLSPMTVEELTVFLGSIVRKNNPITVKFLELLRIRLRKHPRVQTFLAGFFQATPIRYEEGFPEGITIKEVSALVNTLMTFYKIMLYLTNMLVELYMLFRMLKPPRGSSSPFLVMGYHGALHTKNMVMILLHSGYFDYELVYERPHVSVNPSAVPGDYRCITVNTPIYLARDLEERAEAILAHPAHRSAYENYRRVIEAERRGRQIFASSMNGLTHPSGSSKGGRARRARGTRGTRRARRNAKTRRSKRRAL